MIIKVHIKAGARYTQGNRLKTKHAISSFKLEKLYFESNRLFFFICKKELSMIAFSTLIIVFTMILL